MCETLSTRQKAFTYGVIIITRLTAPPTAIPDPSINAPSSVEMTPLCVNDLI